MIAYQRALELDAGPPDAILAELDRLYEAMARPVDRAGVLEARCRSLGRGAGVEMRQTLASLYCAELAKPELAIPHLLRNVEATRDEPLGEMTHLGALDAALRSTGRHDAWARAAERELELIDSHAEVAASTPIDYQRFLREELARIYDVELGNPERALTHLRALASLLESGPEAARVDVRYRDLLARTRSFFEQRGVLEVDTPLLAEGVVVEPHIDPIQCTVRGAGPRFLLASPEGPMKRLLARGSGPIYQIAHAFRDGEAGQRHAPEFAMLEWYRPGFDHEALMQEVEALVRALVPACGDAPFARHRYRDLFVDSVGIDPFATSLDELRAACTRASVPLPADFDAGTIDDALDLLLVGVIEPQLRGPCFVLDYPASQAALARVRDDGGRAVASRFELYVDGLELANGYHELIDAGEQRRRFEAANRARAAAGREPLPIDEDLLTALEQGLPDCAGVALGFDRLLMIAGGASSIDAVRFPHG